MAKRKSGLEKDIVPLVIASATAGPISGIANSLPLIGQLGTSAGLAAAGWLGHRTLKGMPKQVAKFWFYMGAFEFASDLTSGVLGGTATETRSSGFGNK